jgi:NADH-quinone oxidoreductase subunit J
MFTVISFILFAALAIGCGLALVVQRNPLYGAISLIGVFLSLASLYILLAAPFIAAVQIIVYAGAIMVLVVFVIMLLNVEEEERRPLRLKYLVPVAVLFSGVLIAEAAFSIYFVGNSPFSPQDASLSQVGVTSSIGTGLFTTYLLPFEITSLLLLMAIVGAMSLTRRISLAPNARVIPGAQVLSRRIIDPAAVADAPPLVARSTVETEEILGERATRHDDEG